MSETTKQDLLDLAADLEKAGHIEFYEDHGDRAPDGTRLSPKGQKILKEACLFQAEHDKTLKPE